MAKRAKGSFDFCLKQEGILSATWNDNIVVSLVSTFDSVMAVMKATRWIAKEKQKKQVDQPFTGGSVQPLYGRQRPHGPKH